MTRRVIIIMGSSLLILALMFGLWFWLFGRGAEEPPGGSGSFGSGEDVDRGGTSSGGVGGNIQTPINNGTSGAGGVNIQTPLYVEEPFDNSFETPDFSGDFSYYNDVYLPGVVWLDGSYTPPDGSGSSGTGSGVSFTPTPINQVDSAVISGTASLSQGGSGGSGGVGLGGSLATVAGVCTAEFLTQRAASTLVTQGLSAVSNALNFLTFGAAGQQAVYDPNNDANQIADSFIECMVRSLAKVAIREITAQTVNWINSGFNGEPAFVQDFNQFFTSVADKAAGEFIQGSDLAFLCSPFKLQVKIAIAQSYARRNLATAQTCTLSDAVNNVEGFLEGNFSEGGWPGLIAFTTVPSNNPFGAYVTAQVQLNNRIIASTREAERKISQGGFLSQEECSIDSSGREICKIVTPGSTIEASLEASLNTSLRELELASSIDQILGALTNQLITTVLREGLANARPSGAGGNSGTNAAQELLRDLQAAVRNAQQYGSIKQGSIVDIQNAQELLTSLQNCQLVQGNSAGAETVAAQIAALEVQVTALNLEIADANAAITTVQELQTEALLASDAGDINSVAQQLETAQNSGAIMVAADVTVATQDRTALQAQMAALNQQTQNAINQCYAN